jgi:hypothetical protein
MLYGEIIAVCSEIYTKHINTVCGQNVESLVLNHVALYIPASSPHLYSNPTYSIRRLPPTFSSHAVFRGTQRHLVLQLDRGRNFNLSERANPYALA